MRSKVSTLEESPATLMGRAADCLEIVQAQHEIADQQHHHADKLEELARKLELAAIELNGKIVMDARSGPVAPGATPWKLER